MSKNHSIQPAKPVSPDLLERFLDTQGKELELRAQELVLQQQKDKNSFEYSKQAIVIKAEDREKQRNHLFKNRVLVLAFSGLIIISVIGMIVYALSIGKEAFATEIVKAIVFLLTGGAGGYGLAKSRSTKDVNSPKAQTE